jgi:hypothetical protein
LLRAVLAVLLMLMVGVYYIERIILGWALLMAALAPVKANHISTGLQVLEPQVPLPVQVQVQTLVPVLVQVQVQVLVEVPTERALVGTIVRALLVLALLVLAILVLAVRVLLQGHKPSSLPSSLPSSPRRGRASRRR